MYYELGEAGDPVVLIAPLGADHFNWALQVPDLTAAGFRCLTFDSRDVGQSGASTGSVTIGDFADDTAALMDAFGPAFAGADRVVLTDIYPAGEERIAGVTLEALAAAVRRSAAVPVDVVPSLSDVVSVLLSHARAGDIIITLGAGSIGSLADQIVGALEERS